MKYLHIMYINMSAGCVQLHCLTQCLMHITGDKLAIINGSSQPMLYIYGLQSDVNREVANLHVSSF